MDFNEFCKLMNSAILSKEFSEVNDCLQNEDLCFNSNPYKEKTVKSWIWNNVEIPAQTKVFLILKLLGRNMNSYIRPVNGVIIHSISHCLLHYVIKEYYFEEESIEDFEEIARFLHYEFFIEYEEGMTPYTLAYLQRNHDCFNVRRLTKLIFVIITLYPFFPYFRF